MRVTKIHRVISPIQSAWLNEYIDFNTKRRKEAKSNFGKNYFKLINNGIYGKTMENVRKHQHVKLVTSKKRFRQFVAKPTFRSFKIFTDNLTKLHMAFNQIKFYKPIYVGLSILDISDVFMFEFCYDQGPCRFNIWYNNATLNDGY
jgi:hypothetical protein